MKNILIFSTIVLALVISGCENSNEQGRPSDDAVEQIVKKSVENADEAADIIRRIKNGDELSKELAEKILKDTGTMRLLANTLVDGTSLGVTFSQAIEKLVKTIVADPKSYDDLIEKFSIKLNEVATECEWPNGLADEMMESIKKKVDDAIDAASSKADDVKSKTNVGGDRSSFTKNMKICL